MRTSQRKNFISIAFSLIMVAWLFPTQCIGADWVNKWRIPDPQGEVRLASALALAVDPERERFYLADGIAGKLHAFDFKGQHLSTFSGEGKLGVPVSLTLQGSGRFWMIDRADNALLRVIPEQKSLERFPFPLQGKDAMLPHKVVWHSGSGLLVLDRLSGQVLALDDNLKIRGRYGSGCVDVVSAAGTVWILQDDGRVVNLEPKGTGTISKIDLNAALQRPIALERSSEGQLLVADRGLAQVLVFSPEGRHLYSIGAKGRGVGRFNSPRQVVVLRSGTHAGAILVLDEVNRCVDMFVR